MPEAPCQSLFLPSSKTSPFLCDEELGIAVGWKFYVSPSFHLFSYGRSGIKGVEQVFKDRMELYHAHTPVQITDEALSVFQVTEPLLVVFIFGIHSEKGEGLFDFVDVRGTERKLQAQIVFQFSSSKSSVFWVTK